MSTLTKQDTVAGATSVAQSAGSQGKSYDPSCPSCLRARKDGWWGSDGTHCPDCHHSWTSKMEAHCTLCHNQFSSNSAADVHRGPHQGLKCLPLGALVADEKLVQKERATGRVYGLPGERDPLWLTSMTSPS